jgi:hypothetical protein
MEAPSFPAHPAHDAPGRAVDELLRESGLPPFCITEVFRDTLSGAGDDASRQELIEDRRAIVEMAGRRRVLSVVRADEPRSLANSAFARAIRGA